MKLLKPLAFLLIVSCGQSLAISPIAELVEVKKIWDEAPHNAFTDLVYWNERFVCALREGRAHVSTDGKIRVLTSADGQKWQPAALVSLSGYDLRDAGLSIAPDGRLMLMGGACPRKSDNEGAATGTFVSFSTDATSWTEPKIVVPPGRWLWRVTWHEGRAYGVAYGSGKGDQASQLLVSDDGLTYETLVSALLDQGWPTEAVLRFADDHTVYCLQRRDGAPPANSAMLGISAPPYRDWQWHDLEMYLGGPNFLHIPGGYWIAAGRMQTPNEGPKTILAQLDIEQAKLEPILTLPSGGDTSYPGLVWHDDLLWISYYSSHEGKTSVYLAKVKLNGSATALSPAQRAVCQQMGLDEVKIGQLIRKPLFRFTEAEVDTYLRFLSKAEPDLRKRVVHLARKNLGQPYELYLLGEMPFEPYDPQPLYCLGKSDCVVFVEHTYAMALAHNWPGFMRLLQRIRYRDGQIGVVTRNHYTEADWNVSNSWLVEDITARLAGDSAVTFEQVIDRAKFFKNRYGLEVNIPIERHRDQYLPIEAIGRVQGELQDGDLVNVVRGNTKPDAPADSVFGGNAWVGHVGLVVRADDGRIHMIHSTEPKVREEPLEEYIARSLRLAAKNDAGSKPRLLGFKFLRLREDALERLRAIDGAAAPRVTLPSGEGVGF